MSRNARSPIAINWLEISQEVPPEYVEPIAELFQRYGNGGVVIEESGGFNPDNDEKQNPRSNVVLRTYVPLSPTYHQNREMLHIGVALIAQIHPLPPLQEKQMAQSEWEDSWKSHFTPLQVGRRMVIVAPFHSQEWEHGKIPIILDPGLAFGTGHHPTTFHCLKSMESLVTAGCTVLDIGSGSGILSIASAKLGAARTIALDSDPIAVRVGRANFKTNKVNHLVTSYIGSLPHLKLKDQQFDIVLANIHSKALISLAPLMRATLKPEGWLIASGILLEQASAVEKAFLDVGLKIDHRSIEGDWVTLITK
jgi:ribosomal protein L11 methyltransferase